MKLTDITGLAHLAVFDCYLVENTIREKLISLAALETTRRRTDIRGVFEKYRDCMLCTNNTCNSDKSFVF